MTESPPFHAPPTLHGLLGFRRAIRQVSVPPKIELGWLPIFDDEDGANIEVSLDLKTKDVLDPEKSFTAQLTHEAYWQSGLTDPIAVAAWIASSLRTLYDHEISEWVAVDGVRIKEPVHG